MVAERRMLRRRGLALVAPWFLRARGIRFGAGPRFVDGLPLIDPGSNITLGDHVKIRSQQFRAHLGTSPVGTLEIGDRVFINQGATVYATTSIRIGDDTKIADLVAIYDTDFHELEVGVPIRTGPVAIGRNVWIGRGATILAGVTIGDHAVVAAGAVVTSDVPDATLVAGVPARTVRQLEVTPDFVRR